jgi:hypothetical protein
MNRDFDCLHNRELPNPILVFQDGETAQQQTLIGLCGFRDLH